MLRVASCFLPQFLGGELCDVKAKTESYHGTIVGMLWYSTAIFVHAESLDVAPN